MSIEKEPDFRRISRIHVQVEKAALARAVMTLETADKTARDDATARYVRAMDAAFEDLEELRRSGALGRIEAMLKEVASCGT